MTDNLALVGYHHLPGHVLVCNDALQALLFTRQFTSSCSQWERAGVGTEISGEE